MRRDAFALVTFAAMVAMLPSPAAAQSDADRATARSLFFQAQQALDKKDYAAAADLFGRCDALMHAPTTSLGFARAQRGLGRLVGAYETLNRLVREGSPDPSSAAFVKAFDEAKRELAEIGAILPTVVIKVAGAKDPTVTVDGAPVPAAALGVKRFVDPGKHTVTATARGFLKGESHFTVEQGGSTSAEIVLARDPGYPSIGGIDGPEPKPSASASPSEQGPAPADAAGSGATRRTVGFVVGGVGIAGLVVAGVTGGLYVARKSAAEDHCTSDKLCDADGLDAASSAKTLATVNTVALFAGAAAVGIGTYLVLSSPRAPTSPRAALGAFVGSSSARAGLTGRF